MAGYIGKSQSVVLTDIEADSVETADIQDGAVTADKIAAGAVQADKIEEGNSSVEVVDTGTGHVAVTVDGTETARFVAAGDFNFNSGFGSVATAYGCRAWVNFNGTGTVAIRDDGNVSSVADNGTGDYTVNFTTAMPDANYCFTAMAQVTFTNESYGRVISGKNNVAPTTTSMRIVTITTSIGKENFSHVCVSFFR